MNFTVNLKYAGDGSSAKLENVPFSCTISKLKGTIAKINKMESESTIRIVHHGRVLPDSQKLEDLVLSGNSTLVLYVTGIPSKVHNSEQPVNNAESFRTGNANTPLPPNPNGLIARAKKFIDKNLNALIMCIGLIVLTISIAFFNIDSASPRFATGNQNPTNVNYYISFSILLAIGGSIGYLMFKKVSAEELWKCGKLFVLSLLPNFDVDGYLQLHGITAQG